MCFFLKFMKAANYLQIITFEYPKWIKFCFSLLISIEFKDNTEKKCLFFSNREINLRGAFGWGDLKERIQDDRYECGDTDRYALGHPVAHHHDQYVRAVGLFCVDQDRYGTCQQRYEYDLKECLVSIQEEVNPRVLERIRDSLKWIHVCRVVCLFYY